LLASGATTKDAKDKYRHNLVKLLKAAEAAGISSHVRVSEQLRNDIEALNALYATKALQYFSLIHVFHNPALPDLARLVRAAKNLRRELPKVITRGPNQALQPTSLPPLRAVKAAAELRR